MGPKAGDVCPDCGYEPLEDDGMVWCPGCDRDWEPEGSDGGGADLSDDLPETTKEDV